MYELKVKIYKYEELSRESRLEALKDSRRKFSRKGPVYSEELFKNDYEWMKSADYAPFFLEDGTYIDFMYVDDKVFIDIDKMEEIEIEK